MRVIADRLQQTDLDVLLLQEVWTEEVQDTLRAGAAAAGFSVTSGRESGGGLMTLSRKPILSEHFERFRFRGDPERLSQGEFLGGKGFQRVTIEGDDGPISLINTHLHARYRRAKPRLNSAVRMAQLLQIIADLSKSDETVLVGGDFNCSVGDAEYEIFSALSRVVEVSGGGSYPTVSRANYYKRHRRGQDKRIDFLFVRPGSGASWAAKDARLLFDEPARIRDIDRSLSDHFGFRAEIELNVGGATRAGLSPRVPDARALDLARGLLEIGREEADRRERVHFRSAGIWAAAGLLACGARRVPAVDRRRFLRAGASAAAWFALAPMIGFGTLARLDSDQKRDAFEDAHGILAELEAIPEGRTV
jgi:endonuclease/exonuclease/phosphatase family metal-dependent hydrolase